MLIFTEGGKPENPEKNPRSEDENQQQTQPTYDAGSGNRTLFSFSVHSFVVVQARYYGPFLYPHSYWTLHDFLEPNNFISERNHSFIKSALGLYPQPL